MQRARGGGQTVAHVIEQDTFWRAIARQVLRRRRVFVANVYDNAGNMLYQLRRPLYLINRYPPRAPRWRFRPRVLS